MNVIERIQHAYEEATLTATEQQAATFILGHFTDVLVSNSAELSQLSGVSQPTLSRLYRKLGYRNAAEFKHDVRRYHEPGAPETATPVISTEDPVQAQLVKDVQSLRRTYGRISAERINAVADHILRARRVVVVGFRNNYPMALHLREQLLQSRSDVVVLPQPGQSLAEELVDVDERDVVVAFGVRRRTAEFSGVVALLREQRVPMVLIGDSTLLHVAKVNDAELLEADLNARVLSSFTAAFSLVALIADTVASRAIGQEASGEGSGARDRIERINERFTQLHELEQASSRR